MSQSKWKDITALCRAAAAELTDDNPMTSVAEFSLLDSMSAVELMDPKMDQCCGLTGSVITSELIENGCKPVDALSNASLASLLQVLFVHEASFLEGASLMETVHQCVFMWHDSWSHLVNKEAQPVQVLFHFIRSLSHSLGSVFTGVLAADIFEEEDFGSQFREYLGYDFVEPSGVVAALSECIAKLDSDAVSLGEAPSLPGYLSCMLTCRLKLQELYMILAEHTRGIITEYTRVMKKNQRNAGSGQPKEVVTTTAETHIGQCNSVAAAATAALNALKHLEAYHLKLVAEQPSEQSVDLIGNLSTAAERPDIQFAFCSTLAKLVQVSPVRFVPVKPFTDSLKLMGRLCEEVGKVCSVSVDILRANQEESTTLTFEEALFLSLHLSAQRPHILARSFFYAVLHTQSAQIGPMLQKSMRKRGVPNAVVTCELVAQQWLDQNPFSAGWETLKTLCITRNRLHPRMEQVLTLWGAVANDSLFVDEQFRIQNNLGETKHQWCGTWALILSTLMMDVYMSQIVEMNLLSSQELDYFYWYWDYVCATHGYAVEKLRETKMELDADVYRQQVVDAEAAKKSAAAKTTNNKKKSGKDKTKEEPAAPATSIPIPRPLDVTMTEIMMKGRGYLCRGLFRVSVIALQLKLVDKTENRFMSWGTKFDMRFKAFQGVVNPPVLAYGDYLNTLVRGSADAGANGVDTTHMDITKLKIDVNTILSGASVCFQNARKYFDEIRRMPVVSLGDAELQNEALVLTKVAVASSVAVLKTGQLIPKAGDANGAAAAAVSAAYNLNRSYHKQYPVIEISKK